MKELPGRYRQTAPVSSCRGDSPDTWGYSVPTEAAFIMKRIADEGPGVTDVESSKIAKSGDFLAPAD